MKMLRDILKYEGAGLIAGVAVGIILGSLGVAAVTALSGITLLP